MSVRIFKSTAFAPVSPSRTRSTGYDYHAFPVDIASPRIVFIITNPIDAMAIEDGEATFSISAIGTTPITYQWEVSTDSGMTWAAIEDNSTYSGTDSSELTILDAALAMDGYEYRCVATNPFGDATSNSASLSVQSSAADILVVGGGAGGGSIYAGGGAGGNVVPLTISLDPLTSYNVVVGAGGAGAVNNLSKGASGASSFFDTHEAVGGSGGGSVSIDGGNGAAGTLGGGAAGAGPPGTGGAGTAFSGGNGANDGVQEGSGGGGAGAGGNGQNAPDFSTGGNGGIGVQSSISGSPVGYGGGGGGGVSGPYGPNTPGVGVDGGANGSSGAGIAGTDALGGGGGGSGWNGSSAQAGGHGGKGVVIVSYSGAAQFTGGTITSAGGNTIHTFTSDGTLAPI